MKQLYNHLEDDHRCSICDEYADNCTCPPCETCGVIGDPDCASHQVRVGSRKICLSQSGETVQWFTFGYINDESNHPAFYWTSAVKDASAIEEIKARYGLSENNREVIII